MFIRISLLGMAFLIFNGVNASQETVKQRAYNQASLLALLFKASAKGDVKVVSGLLERNRELPINAQDIQGRTALMMAQNGKHKKVVALLERHGAFQQQGSAQDVSEYVSTPCLNPRYPYYQGNRKY